MIARAPRRAARRLAWLAVLAGAATAEAQGVSAALLPTGPWRFRDATVAFFDGRDGLEPTAVYVVHRASDGTMRVGHDGGLSYYTGRRWAPDDHAAPYPAQVRAVAEFDGWLWIGGRQGVQRRWRDSSETYDARSGGLSDPVVYALAVTRALGTPTIVAATSRGLSRWTGAGFSPMPLPPGVIAIGLTAAESQGEDGTTPTLWVASATRGLARLVNGRWLPEPADPEAPMSAEQLVAGPPGSGVEVYAATARGVYERVGGRWRRVPGPMPDAYRLLPLVRADGTRELWVGTPSGQLWRRRERGPWDPVSVARGSAPTPVIALTAVPTPTGEPAVYVGLRGDRLARVTVGPAQSLDLTGDAGPHFVRHLAVVPAGAEGMELWAGLIGDGIVRATSTGARRFTAADGLPKGNVLQVLPWRRAGALEVWAATDTGPMVWRGGRWQLAPLGPAMQPTVGLAVVPDADGSERLMAAGFAGVHTWDGRRWVADTTFPGRNAGAIAAAPGPEGPTAWVVANGLFRRTRRGWVEEHPFDRDGGALTSVAALRLPGGGSGVVVTAVPGVAWRHDGDTTWHRITPATHAGVRPGTSWYALAVANRLYVATSVGVLQFRWVGRDSLVLEAAFAEPDGLPSNEVMTLAALPGGRVVVGTVRGLGVLPPAGSGVPSPPARLLAWVRRNPDGRPVPPGAELPHDVGAVEVELGLQSYHREDETRYRIALEGSGDPPTRWSPRATFTFAALRPGRYTLRAWAQDWRGRESALAPVPFTVRAPWWAAWPALLAYGLALGLGVVAVVRWRVGSLKRRADALERDERRVAASERKFRALFDRAQDAHLLIEDGRVVLSNEAARTLVGAPDDATAATWLARLATPALPEALDDGARLVARVDGTTVPAREVRTPIALEDRTIEHVVLRDVSAVRAARAEAVRLESQLREAQRLESIGTLAGGVAHDFNNLLSIIRGNAELARDAAAGGTPVDGELDELLRATDRARDLVKQILTFSRRSPSRRERVDLAELAHGLRGMLRATIPSTVELRVLGPAGGAWVDGDATQLQQALLNLCTNAEYAMRATNGGRLTITVTTASAPGGEVSVAVADTGTGMPADVRTRIFEPFFTTKPVGEGTGLGLAVLHGIVTAHGGRVSVESSEGVGTVVTLTLPAADAATAPPARPRTTPPGLDAPPGSGEHVFVVDDEPAIRTIAVRVLDRLGYVVTAFEDPRAALAAIADPATRVDLLITDQTMPGMTGDVLVDAARAHRPGLPALIVTGYSHRLTPERVAALGVQVLSKPLGLAELGRAVAAAVSVSSPARPPG